MNEKQRRISKCECCPFYAKNFVDEENKNKWVCTNTGYVRRKGGYNDYYDEKAKICIFDYREIINNDSYKEELKKIRTNVIERWLKANE